MMSDILNPDTALRDSAQSIIDYCNGLLRKAPLSSLQREDIEAILKAAEQFSDFAQAEMEQISTSEDMVELQRIRHRLRNHLNIVVGFSRLLLKELPDNLLLHMLLIRKIHETGEMLVQQVDEIR